MDPYHDDDNSENGDAAGDLLNTEQNSNFFNVIGSTIRDGGFCKPKKEEKKAATRDLDISNIPISDELTPENSESDDSVQGKSRSVTFTAVEPLIIEDDLVVGEDEPVTGEVKTAAKVETEAKLTPPEIQASTTRKTMLSPSFIIVTSVLSVLLALLYPRSMEPIISLVKDNIPMGLGTVVSLTMTVGVSVAPTEKIAVASEISWIALVSIMISSACYQYINEQ